MPPKPPSTGRAQTVIHGHIDGRAGYIQPGVVIYSAAYTTGRAAVLIVVVLGLGRRRGGRKAGLDVTAITNGVVTELLLVLLSLATSLTLKLRSNSPDILLGRCIELADKLPRWPAGDRTSIDPHDASRQSQKGLFRPIPMDITGDWLVVIVVFKLEAVKGRLVFEFD